MLHYETAHFDLLLVESDEIIRNSLIQQINNTKLNVSITTSINGMEAISELNKNSFLCVLMNFDLSDMNAQMLLSSIQDGPTLATPVIVYSKGKHAERLALEILETGAIDFIPLDKCSSFVLERLILHALVREQYIHSQRHFLEEVHQLKISEEKVKNKILMLTKEKAEEKTVAKSEFMANMSHELRTPLNAILGFTQLIAINDGENGIHYENILEIEKAGKHLLTLINGLLDLGKIEADEADLLTEVVDIDKAIEESLTLLQPVAKNNNVNLSLANTSGLQVLADKFKLKQILLNLLSNAIKYNVPQGEVTVNIFLKGELVLLSILDSGSGIAKEKLDEIFHPFKRINTHNSKIEGSGIGLTITKKLIEQMNGKIEVQSERNQGSKFTISLPLAKEITPESYVNDIII